MSGPSPWLGPGQQPLASGDADLGHLGPGAHSRHLQHRQHHPTLALHEDPSTSLPQPSTFSSLLLPPSYPAQSPLPSSSAHASASHHHHTLHVEHLHSREVSHHLAAELSASGGGGGGGNNGGGGGGSPPPPRAPSHYTAQSLLWSAAGAAGASTGGSSGSNARRRLALYRLGVCIVCVAWTMVSSLAILTNKYVMVDLGFRYPITVAWMGLLSTSVLSFLARSVLLPRHSRQALSPHECARRFAPTGFFMALTFVTGNAGYLYLTVAFVQMLKAICPVVTMLLLFAVRLERASVPLVSAVAMIAAGVAAASYGEMNRDLVGLAAMLTSVVAESVRLVMTQQLLLGGTTARGLHPLEGLMYISSACTLWLAVAAAWVEWPSLLHAFLSGQGGGLAVVAARPLAFAAAAAAGFGVNALAILVIKLASSLTLKVLGTCKDAALVTVGVVFLHEQVTSLQLCGYSVSLLGFLAYNVVQATKGGGAGGAGVSDRASGGGGAVGLGPGGGGPGELAEEEEGGMDGKTQ